MSMDDAILFLRRSPDSRRLVHESYLDDDVFESSERFAHSAEFREVRALVGGCATRAILDVGAGTGIASYAFARAGAAPVFALEPSPSHLLGRGAITRLADGLPIDVLAGFAERIPLPDASVDLVYARQVLHHTSNLVTAVRECARVLKPGGLFLACREHVVGSDADLRTFLASHPMQALAGGEHAFSLSTYLEAIKEAGLSLVRVLEPCDSVINAYPQATTAKELEALPRAVLSSRFGRVGELALAVPGGAAIVRYLLNRPRRGHLHTFLAQKERDS